MAAFEKMELALDQIVQLLEEQLPAELDGIVSVRNDGIDLPHPLEYLTAIDTVEEYPTVFILPARSKPQILTSAGMIANHTVHIEVFLANENAAERAKQRLRYLTAVKRVMMRTRRIEVTTQGNIAQTAFSVAWDEDDYGEGIPVHDTESGDVIDSVAVRFTLSADEQ